MSIKNTISLSILLSCLQLNATIYTHTLAAGDYTGAQISSFLNTACAAGDCSSSGSDTAQILIEDGVLVTTNGDWDLTSFHSIFLELEGKESQINFDNNNETIDMSENSFVVIDPANDGSAGDSDGEEGLESANSGNNIFNIGDKEYKGNVYDLITAAGGVSYTGYGLPSVLPIELLYFTGISNNSEVTLDWSTASELNNDRFEILHSIDAINFKTIQEVEGFGTSLQEQHYTSVVYNLGNGSHYFRLRQIDYNGQSEDFDIIAVQVDAIRDFHIYPNPAQHITNISFPAPLKAVTVQLFDSQQQLLMEEYLINADGISLDLSQLPEGIYSIHLSTPTSSATKRLICN